MPKKPRARISPARADLPFGLPVDTEPMEARTAE